MVAQALRGGRRWGCGSGPAARRGLGAARRTTRLLVVETGGHGLRVPVAGRRTPGPIRAQARRSAAGWRGRRLRRCGRDRLDFRGDLRRCWYWRQPPNPRAALLGACSLRRYRLLTASRLACRGTASGHSRKGELDAADGVYDHACGVGGVPHFELEFHVQGHIAEGRAFDADVAPLAVFEPGHIVAGADVDVAFAQVVVKLGGDGVGLADLLRLEAGALQHVVEVHVAAEVELVGAVDAHAALAEEAGQHAVGDGGAHLALDVVADDGAGRGPRSACASTLRGR